MVRLVPALQSAPPAKEAQSSGLDITKLTGLLAPKDGSEVKSFTAKVNGMQVSCPQPAINVTTCSIASISSKREAPL